MKVNKHIVWEVTFKGLRIVTIIMVHDNNNVEVKGQVQTQAVC